MDRPAMPEDGGEKRPQLAVRRLSNTNAAGLRLLAVCFMSFTVGLSDTAPTVLRPNIEK